MGLLDKKASISNIQRNRIVGALADSLQAVKDNTGVVGDFMLGQAPEVVNNMSYGFNPTRGQGMTYGLKPEAADLANILPAATIGGLLGKSYSKLAGKEIARQVQGKTGLLGRNAIDPRMNMIAYHGSPHSFDKFDNSKIGTGEGAQAYGNGLYFAESPDVAKAYQTTAKMDTGDFYINNQKVDTSNIAEEMALQAVRGESHYSVGENPIDRALTYFKGNQGVYSDEARNQKNKQAFDYLNNLKLKDAKFNAAGSFYKVDIPDEAIPKMLDWDKPLSAQSQHVQAALSQAIAKQPNMTGAELYNVFAGIGKGHGAFAPTNFNYGKQASQTLAEKGITGIRYLDGNSRGAGGTSNFVVFDDKLPTILERNGQSINK